MTENRSLAVVTTFNEEGYKVYGRKMMDTFNQYWPKDINLYVYYEGANGPISEGRIHIIDLLKKCPDLVAFKERWKDDPMANGHPTGSTNGLIRPPSIQAERKKKVQAFLWDAVRFSHKSYCIINAALTFDVDMLFWLDADSITFEIVPVNFPNQLLPEEFYCSHLGRDSYSETGFIGFNLRHVANQEFMNRWKDLYNDDELFKLKYWIDCEAFDTVRKQMEREGKIKSNNLTPNIPSVKAHPFINSVLGDYLDHLKGRRKNIGRSSTREIKLPKKSNYWKRK